MATICDKCGSNMVLDGETWACASPTCGHTQQSMQAKKCQCGGVIIQVRVRLCFRLIRGGKAWASVYWLRRTSFSTGPQPALPPVSFTAVAMSHLFSELSLSLSLSLNNFVRHLRSLQVRPLQHGSAPTAKRHATSTPRGRHAGNRSSTHRSVGLHRSTT